MLVRLQDSCGNWVTVNLAVGVTADDIGLGNVQSDLEYLTTRKAKMSNATPDSHGQVIGNVCLSSDFTINSDGEISLSATPTTMADYIVEEGTDGIWTYRKWNSGIAECWGTKTYSNMAITTQYGSLYHSGTLNEALPSGLFNAAPRAFVSVKGTGCDFVSQVVCLTNSTVQFIWMNATPYTANGSADFYAIGKWK